jgi:gamma-glutamyl-gamma-aminobutyrate hydrolase PuuD
VLKFLKMRNTKIFVVGNQKHYAKWTGYDLVPTMEAADVVMFTGGEDVDPSLYGEKVGQFTAYNRERDDYEIEVFEKAKKLGKKLVGICRGNQFLCVMAGGKLVQHVNNHGIAHKHEIINILNGKKIDVTSTHHQMAYPFNLPKKDYLIVGYTENRRGTTFLNGDNEEIKLPKDFVEPEIVLFKTINALGIQGHPEMMVEGTADVNALKEILTTFMQIKKFNND